jgi:hypothetical protein
MDCRGVTNNAAAMISRELGPTTSRESLGWLVLLHFGSASRLPAGSGDI